MSRVMLLALASPFLVKRSQCCHVLLWLYLNTCRAPVSFVLVPVTLHRPGAPTVRLLFVWSVAWAPWGHQRAAQLGTLCLNSSLHSLTSIAIINPWGYRSLVARGWE